MSKIRKLKTIWRAGVREKEPEKARKKMSKLYKKNILSGGKQKCLQMTIDIERPSVSTPLDVGL